MRPGANVLSAAVTNSRKCRLAATRCRIAKPKEFYPFSKEKVAIKGADTVEDITLLRVTPGEFLPPFPEIAALETAPNPTQSTTAPAEVASASFCTRTSRTASPA
jgi:hypothetical protein